ncbi:MAG: hypothetical protein HYR88_16090 [Verrucomicrobia bacterium]|nr:hypothetical protein [Verrucomicrobiota bacterium]MBI3868086.1 hypothetical protein [Verrucomicrobiota bacterium]
MKHIIALLAVSVSVLRGHAGMSDLDAISMIESGGNDRVVGSAGEVSRYQIMPNVWRAYTASREYQNAWVSREIAREHLGYLLATFQHETGRVAQDFDLYVLWNAGVPYYRRIGFRPDRVAIRIRNRAERFVNLKRVDLPRRRADPPRLAANW